jgi:hypothetical protein
MKLALAAPASGLPFLSIAFGSQTSFAHFVMKLFSAAPASGLPHRWGQRRPLELNVTMSSRQ